MKTTEQEQIVKETHVAEQTGAAMAQKEAALEAKLDMLERVGKRRNARADAAESKAEREPEQVLHPSHYNSARVECIDIIEDLELGFNEASALRYLWRKGRKGGKKTERIDLEKSRFYIDREIARRGGASWNPSGRKAKLYDGIEPEAS